MTHSSPVLTKPPILPAFLAILELMAGLCATLSAQSEVLNYESLPVISRLYHGEVLYDQVLSEVADFHEARAARKPLRPLLLLRYRVKKDETLFMIAARLSIPMSSIASLNKLASPTVNTGDELLIPSQPGLFIPLDANLSASHPSSKRLEGRDGFQVAFQRGKRLEAFLFYPDEDFDKEERKSFLVKTFVLPFTPYRITSGFGKRSDPFTGKPAFHNGIDLAAPKGTRIKAVAAGVVKEVGFEVSYGNYVVIEHADGWRSLYAHMASILARKGSAVAAGAPVGTLGSTGRSTGPHLHLTLFYKGQARDPAPLLGLR